MSEREYIVSLNRGVDYDQFWDQIENESVTDGFVPSRRVDIVNNRDGSLRSCHYALSDEEAEQLRNDPRVYSVEIPPDQRDDITIGHDAVQTGNFTKTTSDTGDFVNWGLRRSIFENLPTFTSGDEYTYNLDGTGVDVVIQDSGIQADHPDFNDENGVSRVQQIDWYAASGLAGTMPTGHYTDYDGHGTHCAGIAAGRTYGWAKNARIYAVKVNGLEGTSDPNPGIPISDVFDVIKLWHRNKPIDPVTGYKRPTIVNMSWGYSGSRLTAFYGTYRGTVWDFAADYNSNNTSLWAGTGVVPGFFQFGGRLIPVRVSSVDVDLQELIDEGVHVCIAAGNNYYKVDVPGGVDYDNTAYFGFGNEYYHRGSSPYDSGAFIVGNIDSNLETGGLEQKAASSTTGPGVDIYAPGTNIMSTCSTTTRFASGEYPANTAYKITNISGTSMASPQVCGVGALILQANPHATTTQLKTYLTSNSANNKIYSSGLDDDYSNNRSILSGNNYYLYNPLNSQYQLRITTE
jgi:subtilisin family serine protease